MKKAIIVMSLMAVAAWAQAQTAVWNPAANPSSDGAWTDGANWTTGVAPDNVTKAVFNVGGAMNCQVSGAAIAGRVVAGDNGPGGTIAINNGGTLTVGNVDWTAIGYNNTAAMVMEEGGAATFAHHLWIGFAAGADGTLTMNGGTISVTGMTGLGWGGGKGTALILGGTLNLAQFHPTDSIKGLSVMDIGGGTIILDGDHVSPVNTYINSGKIVAYSGSGTVLVDYDVTNAGKTTLTALRGDEPPVQTAWDPSNNPSSDGTWAQDANWTGGRKPGNLTRVDFNITGADPCLVASAASAGRVIMGDNGPGGTLIVNSGAALLVGPTDWSAIGLNNTGTLQVESYATVNFGGDLWVGHSSGSSGQLIMNGGTVTVAGRADASKCAVGLRPGGVEGRRGPSRRSSVCS
jgi:hypothetical protein